MGSESIEDRFRSQSENFRKLSWPILIFSIAVTVGLAADLAFVNTPSFHTDLSDFAPESESADAHERISKHFTNETRPMFIHVTRDDGGNVLDLASIVEMDEDLAKVKNKSNAMQDFVVDYITAPSLIQIALDEEQWDSFVRC